MRYRNLFLLYGLIFLICLSQAAHSENTGGHGVGDGTTGSSSSTGSSDSSGTGERSTAPNELTSDIVNLLTKYFNPSEAYIKSRFEKTLPDALAKSIERTTAKADDVGSDEELSKDLAELFGQLGDEQVLKLKEELGKGASYKGGSCGGASEKLPKIEALKARILWAAEHVLPREKDPKELIATCGPTRAGAFRSVFKKYWDDVKKGNDEFHEKLKQAKEGNAAAIEFINTKYKGPGMAGFLEHEAVSGREEVANDLAKALATKTDKGHFIDGTLGGDNQTRVALGKDPKQFASKIRELKTANQGLGRLELAPNPYDAPTKYWVPKSLEKDFTPPAARDPKTTPAKETSTGATSGGGSTTGGTSGSTASSGDEKNQGFTLLTNSCVGCHSGQKPRGTYEMKAKGFDRAEAIKILARIKSTDDGEVMPPPPKARMTADQIKEIENYLTATK